MRFFILLFYDYLQLVWIFLLPFFNRGFHSMLVPRCLDDTFVYDQHSLTAFISCVITLPFLCI